MSRSRRIRTLVEFPISGPSPSSLGVMVILLVGGVFAIIMAMAISALLGVDPTTNFSPVPTEVHKP